MEYDPDIGDEICERLSDGQPLKVIVKQPGMPRTRDVYRWMREHATFAKTVELALQDFASSLAHETIEISDTPVMAEKVEERTDEKGTTKKVITGDAVDRSRLKVDTRRWLASRIAPDKYGERVNVKHDLTSDLAEQIHAARKRAAER